MRIGILFLLTGMLVVPAMHVAFGHGLGGEVLDPVTIGNRNATVSLQIEPAVFDPQNPDQRIQVKFFDADTEQVIENVTYIIEITKGGEQLFRYMFFDDIGFLILKVVPTDSDKIEVIGQKEPVLGGWMEDGTNPVIIKGPIFDSGGLYNFNVEILTIDEVTKVLDERVVYNGAISVADKSSYKVNDENKNQYNLGITSWYDEISNFEYEPETKQVSFSMPFSWDYDYLDQIDIVHQELHVPKNFGDLLVTKYDLKVNGIEMPESSIVADDYSEKDRIVHMILHKEGLKEMSSKASEASKESIIFEISPNLDDVVPLSGHTTSVEYKVDLSWEPPIIQSSQNTRFYVDVAEIYPTVKDKMPIEFDFILEKNGDEIFRKSVNGHVNAESKSNFIDVEFSKEHTGPVNVIIDKINDKSLATTDFMIVVEGESLETSQGWERLADMPEVRSEMESAVIGDKIYVLGGLNNANRASDSVFVFDTVTESWSIGNPMPIALHHAAVASFEGKLYVIGGYLDGWIPSSTLLIYDSKLDSWSTGPDMPTPRGALTANFVDEKLYAVGGFNEFTRSENEMYDPASGSWQKKSPMPTPREHLASAVLDEKLYVIGGRASQFNSNANEAYDYKIDSWKSLEPLPTARSGLTASTLSGAIFVFGGEGQLNTFEENEAFLPGEGWFTQQPMPISRHGLASSTVGENIYLFGGGVIPGFSFSAITEKYHNTVVPEFGIIAPAVLAITIAITVLFSRNKTGIILP